MKLVKRHSLTILKVDLKDTGYYTCRFPNEKGVMKSKSFFIQSIMTPRIASQSLNDIKISVDYSGTLTLSCVFEVYPMYVFVEFIKWKKIDEEYEGGEYFKNFKLKQVNNTFVNTSLTLDLDDASRGHNGTYMCFIDKNLDDSERAEGKFSVFIVGSPSISIDFMKAVGASKIFTNWTIDNGNDPTAVISILYQEEGTVGFIDYWEKIKNQVPSKVLINFKVNTNYRFRLVIENAMELTYSEESDWIKTLKEDPIFIPEIEIFEVTHKSIYVGWNLPPLELSEFYQYYELVILHHDKIIQKEIYPEESHFFYYLIENLRKSSIYELTIRGCSQLTRECGPYSKEVNVTTDDLIKVPGIEYSPDLKLKESSSDSIAVEWLSPPVEIFDYFDFYEIYVYQSCFSKVYERKIVSMSKNFEKISNLKSSTVYFVEMRICNEKFDNCGPFSHTLRVTTQKLHSN